MRESRLTAADHFVDEKSHAKECGENQNIAWDAGTGAPVEGVEHFSQQGAKSSHDSDLPALQDAANHQHGKQIKKAQGDVLVGTPVDEGNEADKHSCFEQNGLGTTTEKKRKHRDARYFSHILDTP